MFDKFSPLEVARLAYGYMNNMTDKALDNLPYWLVLPNKKPAEAAHCRVDDAELVGSWYEGADSLTDILENSSEDTLCDSFRRHMMKSWGEHGLRFHENYPWTHTNHSSFHEMGYILPALNRITIEHPEDEEAEMRTSELVKGLRSLVIERKVRTFWSGDFNEEEKIYEFPNDVYLKDGGFDMSRYTGRGEQAIRNAIMLYALVERYHKKGDEAALDLAVGLANYVLGPSRYFNYKMEFFGHVHSAMWFASGLVYLGRITENDRYIKSGRGIFEYVKSLSSSFGWVPEYAQWHPMSEEHCETCCIKDMIQCAYELIKCGYNEYWDLINRYARNQLVENQIRYSGYVTTDNSLPDSEGITYHDLDKRILGGFTGGSEPGSISLTRFRSIAGCCVGMAPVGLKIVWDNAVTVENGILTVNIPFDKKCSDYEMTSDIPNTGIVTLTPSHDCKAGFRIYGWMGKSYELYKNGCKTTSETENGIVYTSVKACEKLELRFEIRTLEVKETVRDTQYTVVWRACDVVDLLPRGAHVRLYQRNSDIPKYYPLPEDVEYTGAANYAPTQMKQK